MPRSTKVRWSVVPQNLQLPAISLKPLLFTLNFQNLFPAEIVPKPARTHQLFHVVDSFVSWTLEVLNLDPILLIYFKELLRSPPGSPLRFELRQKARNLGKVRTVTTEIGTRVLGVFDSAAGNGFPDNLGNFADSIVL